MSVVIVMLLKIVGQFNAVTRLEPGDATFPPQEPANCILTSIPALLYLTTLTTWAALSAHLTQ